jgi:N-acetylglucosaminyl-diphospho-decaprenol L-rhamnosyltransferase
MSVSRPELSIVIVCHNGWPDLNDCLRSLREHSGSVTHEVIVIDNDSRDSTPDRVEQVFPDIHLVRNPENRGFPAANNQGVAAARGRFLLFLNPDTMVGSGALERLLKELRERPELGGVGPALRTEDGGFQVSFGGRLTFGSELMRKLYLNSRLRRRIGRWSSPRKVGWLSGACLMVRREALPAPEPFDEGFFLYFEDIDLCFRMRTAGWPLAFVPGAQVRHKGGGSTRARPLFSRYHYRRSQLRFYRRHNSPLSLAFLKIYLLAAFTGLFLKKPPSGDEAWFDRKRFFALLGRRADQEGAKRSGFAG